MILGFIWLACSAAADDLPVSFTYQGRLFDSSGTAPLTSTVGLKFEILNPGGTCILYEETQTGIDLALKNGLFAVNVGSAIGDTKRSGKDPGLSMATVIANRALAIRADDTATTNSCPGATRRWPAIIAYCVSRLLTVQRKRFFHPTKLLKVCRSLLWRKVCRALAPMALSKSPPM